MSERQDDPVALPPLAADETLHADLLRFFPDLVTELGGDPAGLLARTGIGADGATRISYRQFVHLLERAADELARPDLGLLLAARQDSAVFGPLGDVIRSAPSFGAMLAAVTGNSHVHSPVAGIWLRRYPERATVLVGHDILLEGLPHRAQAMEQILLLGHDLALEVTGGQARARRVLFRHQPLSAAKTYRRHFGCAVRFGQHADAILYHDRDLACPIVAADQTAHGIALAAIERSFAARQQPLKAQVRGIVTHFLGTDMCNLARVAAEVHLHPRTMDRRLAAEGTSFRRIKEDVRRDRLLYLLRQTDMDLTAVSEQLGFAEQSVMSRSCRKWFRLPPSRLRAMMHAGAAG